MALGLVYNTLFPPDEHICQLISKFSTWADNEVGHTERKTDGQTDHTISKMERKKEIKKVRQKEQKRKGRFPKNKQYFEPA